MSFKAILKIKGEEFNVLNCSYSLMQETDQRGLPSSICWGGKITITVESTSNTVFAEWIMNSWQRESGSIAFLKKEMNSTAKELTFDKGYMVKYNENFNMSDKLPMTETFTISCQKIGMGTAEHVNEWPGEKA